MDLEAGDLELSAELLSKVLGEALRAVDLTHGKLPFRVPGAKLRLLLFDREDPFLDGVEKVVVTGHRLEIHLALPVSGSYELRSTRGAKRSSPQTASTIHLQAQKGRLISYSYAQPNALSIDSSIAALASMSRKRSRS